MPCSSTDLDGQPRVALLRAFQKEPRLLAAVTELGLAQCVDYLAHRHIGGKVAGKKPAAALRKVRIPINLS